jgi:ATP/maltotriose-dependent transcriptional regulator MalT
MSTFAEPRSPPHAEAAVESPERPAAYSPLVLTKIRVPRLRPRLVERPRLLAALGMDAGLVLVSAPAGYGKTTLLAAWSHTRAQAGLSVAWYSLDPSDNDSISFGSYVVASLCQVLESSAGLAQVAELLRSSPEVDQQKVMSAIINAVATSDRQCLLILDDYHLVTALPVHQSLAFLLEHRPDNLQIAIGTRSDPPLPIAKLRAQGQVAEVRAADLRFTLDETAEFLNDVMQLALTADTVAALEARTEGWVAGLQLAALSLAGRSVDVDRIVTFQGNSRFVIQYLLDEVVSRQSEDVQEFLSATSVLERLCAPLCDALLGRPGSGQILDRLDRANLFVVVLDEQAVWYRYHHLFREFLRTRLEKAQPERVALLHRRASEWHEARGNLREAIWHAIETRDWEYAAELVERHGMATLMHSEFSTVYDWCKAFPEAVLRTHPFVCVLQGWTLVLGYRGDHRERVEHILDVAEQAAAVLEDADRGRWLTGQAAVVRLFLGNIPDAHADAAAELDLCQRALDLLTPGEPLRSTTMLMVGYSHLALQQPEQAYVAFEEARRLSLAGMNYYGALEARFQQARLAHAHGQLRRAAELCQMGRADIAAVIAQPEHELPAVGSLDLALGCLRLEQNQLVEAEQLLLRGLDILGLRTGAPYFRLIGSLALARLREIQGLYSEAGVILDHLAELWPDVAFCVEAVRMMHALRNEHSSGVMASVVAWSHHFSASLGDDLPLPGMGPLGAAEAYYIALLAWARVRIAAGAATEALVYLEPQLLLARAHDINARVIELSLAEGLAHAALGDNRRAMEGVARALELGEPEGFLRTFDGGPGIIRLLVDAAHHGIAREYIGHIMESIGPVRDGHSNHAAAAPGITGVRLVEPLTEREMEVLRLLDSGLANRQIADRLVITVGTVKRHTANIYGKLGVETRTQAIVRARSLGLV